MNFLLTVNMWPAEYLIAPEKLSVIGYGKITELLKQYLYYAY